MSANSDPHYPELEQIKISRRFWGIVICFNFDRAVATADRHVHHGDVVDFTSAYRGAG